MLKAENIHKSYGNLHVLKGVSVTLHQGEVVALVGASGAGKSTLLQILGTLDQADQGHIFFEANDVTKLNERQQAAFRNKSLGFVFQFHHLLPEFTALENVSMPGWILGGNAEEIQLRATSLIERLGLGDRINHRPSQMSGGELQRIAIARAMINQPSIVLADEPTGNLDSKNSEALYELIFELARLTNVSFLIATHDLKLADQADRKLVIQDGIFQL